MHTISILTTHDVCQIQIGVNVDVDVDVDVVVDRPPGA